MSSTTAPPWIESLRCPRCAGSFADAAWVCGSCGFAYPSYGGIPVLVARPHELVEQWRFRLDEFNATMDNTRARIVADLATKPLHPRTRARLERLNDGLPRHRARVGALLGEAGITPAKRSVAEPEGVPGEGSVTSYFHQVHRDWGWDDDGSDENRRALEAVLAALGPAPSLGQTLVIGAGAGRLASDVHVHARASTTVAIDINPLPLLVARRVLAGERVPLFEFPIAPPDLEHVWVERELHAPAPLGPEFVPMFADGFAPPFRDGSFDTVFTPWFIDEVPTDMAGFFPLVHRLLRPGGRWINHGPLIYHPNHTELPARYASDEVFALVEDAGFVLRAQRRDRLVYMQSPACTRGRTEVVLTFVAERGEVPVRAVAPAAAPAWLDDAALVVPRFAGLDGYRAPHPLFAAVAQAIDGERSAAAIAELLVQRNGLPRDVATAGVLSCLKEIWRATQAP